MCGIVGAIANRDVTGILLEGLKRLEYRGYDSAGVAIIDNDKNLQRQRTQGKVKELADALIENPLIGELGIAHTRWATHGKPHVGNAHPHVSGNHISLVHNGIIENHETLRRELIADGYVFVSETDTEVIVHLIDKHIKRGETFLDAVKLTTQSLDGAYALGVINTFEPDCIIAVRRGSPLVIGVGFGENFLASDHLALLPVVDQFIYLEEGDLAVIKRECVIIQDVNGVDVQRPTIVMDNKHDVADKGAFRHYMLKEIYEQPEMLAQTLSGRLSDKSVLVNSFGVDAQRIFEQVEHVQIVACGTSYHAGLVARYWIEDIAKIPCQVEVASEIRYRNNIVNKNTLYVTISQSGETADTLAALRQAQESGYLATLGICNVPASALVREADLVLMTRAGSEVGVASTKAFTTQLTALALLVISLGHCRRTLSEADEYAIVSALKHLPGQAEGLLNLDSHIASIAKDIADKNNALFVARGVYFPIVLEGALKLKEISYIHAEAYPAGELKHGPLALVDKDMPVIAIVNEGELFEKTKSNLHEISARDGSLVIFTDKPEAFSDIPDTHVIALPKINLSMAVETRIDLGALLGAITHTIPLQLLAYHVAVRKGTDVDQPRNLAKSVTVE